MRLDRSRRAQDIWMGEKMIFFAVGAALGLGGMVTGQEWLIWAAIVVLLIGFVLRLMGRRRGAGGADTADAHDVPPPEERDSDWAQDWDEREGVDETPEQERPDDR